MASSADMLFSYVAVYVALRTRVRGCLLAEGVVAVALLGRPECPSSWKGAYHA
ncbi:hypothetical protein M433DRAFT_9435 [Acidomyces richmondensis BFW]|nr:hypothetical protein M433DRAFT_9435 [Acidomyces richmondensis BFW]